MWLRGRKEFVKNVKSAGCYLVEVKPISGFYALSWVSMEEVADFFRVNESTVRRRLSDFARLKFTKMGQAYFDLS